MKRALIIGGGFAGCCAAHMLHQIGWHATIIERGPELGAGVRTKWYGGHPFTFGPRHFLTKSDKVWSYMNDIVPLRDCGDHQFWTYVEGDEAFYNFPIHLDDIPKMPEAARIHAELNQIAGSIDCSENFEEFWIASVGETLYRKMVDGYSRKMWRVSTNRSIDTFNWSPKGVTLKSGPRAAWDSAKSGYPFAGDGYNGYFDIATAEATVHLSTEIKAIDMDMRRVWMKDMRSEIFDLIINTASPDDIMGGEFGGLRYIGRDFHKLVLPIRFAFPEDVYFLYYAGEEAFTRLVEYKQFTRHESPTTLLGIEIPSMNGRHYPMPTKSEQARAALYHVAMPKGVYSIGRLGSYRYGLDIAGCIEQVFAMVEEISQGGQEHAVPLAKWRAI